mmetsp:Transcript_2446/g.9537  ORF Transcript_2446/g.9537 Transcript_2446/m.9537 type:complete len:425 (+) Transcript_2446:84-1358(+)
MGAASHLLAPRRRLGGRGLEGRGALEALDVEAGDLHEEARQEEGPEAEARRRPTTCHVGTFPDVPDLGHKRQQPVCILPPGHECGRVVNICRGSPKHRGVMVGVQGNGAGKVAGILCDLGTRFQGVGLRLRHNDWIHSASTATLHSNDLQDEGQWITLEKWNILVWRRLDELQSLRQGKAAPGSVAPEACEDKLEDQLSQMPWSVNASHMCLLQEVGAKLTATDLVLEDMRQLRAALAAGEGAEAEQDLAVDGRPLLQLPDLRQREVHPEGVPEECEGEDILDRVGDDLREWEGQMPLHFVDQVAGSNAWHRAEGGHRRRVLQQRGHRSDHQISVRAVRRVVRRLLEQEREDARREVPLGRARGVCGDEHIRTALELRIVMYFLHRLVADAEQHVRICTFERVRAQQQARALMAIDGVDQQRVP